MTGLAPCWRPTKPLSDPGNVLPCRDPKGRYPTVRVTGVETFLIHPGRGKNLLMVKVSTDEGIHGWGEAYTQADRDQSIEWTIHQMARYLVGRDPFNIKHFTYVMYNDFLGKRG